MLVAAERSEAALGDSLFPTSHLPSRRPTLTMVVEIGGHYGFRQVIQKAAGASSNNGQRREDHFGDVGEMIPSSRQLGPGRQNVQCVGLTPGLPPVRRYNEVANPDRRARRDAEGPSVRRWDALVERKI